MKSLQKYIGIGWLFLAVFMAGCSELQPSQPPGSIDAEATIGSISEIYFFEAIPLRGIGIVAGLYGGGSSECPPRIRRNLEKYIWQHVTAETAISPRDFINSKDTAVVEVFGVIPSLVSGQETFDVAVRPLSGTQTISLDGGHLYTTELKELSRLVNIDQFAAFSKIFATVEGPIFTNRLNDKNAPDGWYVLGGAKVLEAEKVTLILNTPDFLVANAIRNRINERFGEKTAIAASDSQIQLHIPLRYQAQKERFLKMVQSLSLGDNAAMKKARIENLIAQLLSETDKETPEIALEAIGRQAANALSPHLKHPDEGIRFHAARCMLNTRDDRAVTTLRTILMNPNSPYRLAAVEALGRSANRSDARSALMLAVGDPDIRLRLAAYEALLRTRSPIVNRTLIAGSIAVDSVACSGPKMIYVFQQNTPRIVLFGSPVYCEKNLFVQSDDGSIIANAKPGDAFVSVSRKHPNRPRVIGPIQTGYEVSHLLQTLGELPQMNKHSSVRSGLAIPYDEIVVFLKKMCEVNAIDAEFVAGPPAKIEESLENLPPIEG